MYSGPAWKGQRTVRSLALDYLASVAEQTQRGTEFRLSSYHYSSQGRTLSSPEMPVYFSFGLVTRISYWEVVVPLRRRRFPIIYVLIWRRLITWFLSSFIFQAPRGNRFLLPCAPTVCPNSKGQLIPLHRLETLNTVGPDRPRPFLSHLSQEFVTTRKNRLTQWRCSAKGASGWPLVANATNPD